MAARVPYFALPSENDWYNTDGVDVDVDISVLPRLLALVIQEDLGDEPPAAQTRGGTRGGAFALRLPESSRGKGSIRWSSRRCARDALYIPITS